MPLAEDLGLDDVKDVLLNVFGMEGTDLGNGEFRILCPVHERDGEGHTPSADVNLTTGQWNCFSCSASGDIIGLGKLVLGSSRPKVTALLRPNEPTAIAAAVQGRSRRRLARLSDSSDIIRSPRGHTDIPALGSYRKGPLDSILKRGFRKATLKKWGLRFAPEVTLAKTDGDTFRLRNNIAIPIVGMSGEPVCWCYRATEDSDYWQIENAKYVYTPGLVDVLNKSWFGLYHHQDEGEIVVVEGALDAMWLDQAGIPAVAMLGTATKQFEKVYALTRFRRVTIFPDRDEPGLIAALKLGDRLQSYGTPVRIGLYREWMTNARGEQASDPQELAPLDLELVHASALPWQVWRRRPGVSRLANEIRRNTEGK